MLDRIFGRGRPIRNRVILAGVYQDKPAFEFQGEAPPDWLMKALRDKVIHVADGVCHLRETALTDGAIVHRKDVA